MNAQTGNQKALRIASRQAEELLAEHEKSATQREQMYFQNGSSNPNNPTGAEIEAAQRKADFDARIKAHQNLPDTPEERARLKAEIQQYKMMYSPGGQSSRPQDMLRNSYGGDADELRKIITAKVAAENGITDPQFSHPAYRALDLQGCTTEQLLPILADAKEGFQGAHEQPLLMQGVTRDDVPAIIAELGAVKAQAVYSEGLDAVRWADTVELKDYIPTPYSQAAASDLKPIPEGGRFPELSGHSHYGAKLIDCSMYGGILSCDASLAINDSAGVFMSMVESQAQGAARMVRKMVFQELDANPLLSDGVPVFDASRGNIGPVVGLTAESVSAAVSTLAKIKAVPDDNHDVLDLQARYLIVHTDDLLAAQKICADLVMPGSTPLVPIASAFLGTEFYYVMPDPSRAACIARTTLQGDEITVDTGKRFESPSQSMKFRFTVDAGAHAVSHYAVRVAMA